MPPNSVRVAQREHHNRTRIGGLRFWSQINSFRVVRDAAPYIGKQQVESRPVRLDEISTKKEGQAPMADKSMRGGGETADALRGFASSVEAGVRRLHEWVEDNPETMRRWRNGLLAFKLAAIDDIAAKDDSEVRARLFEQESLRTLAQHGWYPPSDKSLVQLNIWADGLGDPDEDRSESARRIGFKIFREDAHKIKQTLVDQFPCRASILREAFDAHWDGRYNSSVLLFLVQADGICQEAICKSIYSSVTIIKASDLANHVQQGMLRALFMGLMWKDWPLTLSQTKRPDGFSELNRHQVVHGESTDYGTEENSLKAMSFLNFCAFVFEKKLK